MVIACLSLKNERQKEDAVELSVNIFLAVTRQALDMCNIRG